MKKITALLLSLIVAICAFSLTASAESLGITITAPSSAETVIASGRAFYVIGSFQNGAELKDGDTVSVELKNSDGEIVRTVSSSIMSNSSMWLDFPALSYYGDDKNVLLTAGMPDLIWDGENESSFHSGSAKLYYDNDGFAALIAGGGADALELVDENGNEYEPLAEGEYTITVSAVGETVSESAEMKITVGTTADKLLARFSPAAHYDRIIAFANENNLRVYNDLFPGYWSKGDIFAEILPEWRAADSAEYVNGKAHFVIYNIKGTCAAYTVELSALQKTNAIDDEARLQCYYYQYGEPTLADESGTVSEIVPFESGDKLQLLRAEITDSAEDGVMPISGVADAAYDLDLSDGITASVGDTVSLYGVTAPIQLEESEIVDEGSGAYSYADKISTIRYTLPDGTTVDKAVSLNRTDGDWNNYSELEFKHCFEIAPENAGKALSIKVEGLDAEGNFVEGTAEELVINVAPEAANPETGVHSEVALISCGCAIIAALIVRKRKK